MENTTENRKQNVSSLNKDFDLDIAKTVIRKHWYIVPIVIIISLFSAFIYLRYTKPLYQSSAIIQRTSKDEGKRILEIDNFEQESKLSEDVELLKSTFLLEKALKNLNLKTSYYSEGKILTEEKYLHSPYHITLLTLKDSSLLSKPIYVNKLGDDNIELTFNTKRGEQKIKIQDNEFVDNEFFNLIFKINNQDRFYSDVSSNKLFFVFNNYNNLTNRLHKNLNVFVINPEAKTVQISFKSNNSTLSSDVVSSVINTFFEYDLEKKSQSSENILNFIDGQLDTVFNQLKLSELNIQSFKDDNQSKDPEYFKGNVISQIDLLQKQSLEAELEYELLKDINFGINSRDRIEVYNLIPVIVGTRFQSLLEGQLNKLHELLVKKEDASYGMTKENQALKKLETNIDIQIETINRTVQSIKRQVKGKRDNIQKKINDLEGKLYGVPQKEMEMSRLKRKFNLNEKYYTLLIEKRTQYEISKAGYTMDNLILQQPSLPKLISPQKELIYSGVFVLSFLIGFLVLVVKYVTFNVIHNEEELKKLVPQNVGFMGVVPNVNIEQDHSLLMVHLKPKSVLAETYRNIRSNMQFILNTNQSNVIAISSSVSGEGKTFVALNLAGIITMSGKKVIVLDLDLRKPKVHFGFKAENKTGMSSILAGKSNWKNCLQQTEIEHLDFISAGTIPPNPSELIINGNLDDLIKELKADYDFIIIDNPPVGIVSDGVNVLSRADCAIYVFRANYSKRIFANRVRELLNVEKVNKLFMILNDVDIAKKSYGYGYGYGGYYEEDKTKKKGLFRFFKK